MITMDKKAVIQLLYHIGALLELTQEQPYRARAYYAAANALQRCELDMKQLIDENRLFSLSGIGHKIGNVILEFYHSGTSQLLEALRQLVPTSLLDLLELPGLGPRKVRLLYHELGITSLSELEQACTKNHIAKLKGFGTKTQEKLLKAIRKLRKKSRCCLLAEAAPEIFQLKETLNRNPQVYKVEVSGQWRRRCGIIERVPVVYIGDDDHIRQALSEYKSSADELRLHSGPAIELVAATQEDFGTKLWLTTGSKEHVNMLGGAAIGDFCSEEELYSSRGLPYIAPELREGLDELSRARSGRLPDLLQPDDITGVFHVHSTYSDGADTIATLAAKCRELGYRYLGIADHSRSAFYASGLAIAAVKRQLREIDELNQENKEFRIFKGIECEILSDGSLDYPDEILAEFDFVIASVHSHFNMSEAKMTDRIVRAVRHPLVTMLGHPTGRLLLDREGCSCDMDLILEECLSTGTIVELNANPRRLDLPWRQVKKFIEMGGMISINPDAHRAQGLEDTIYGVFAARKAGVEKRHVLNAQPLSRVLELLLAKRSKLS